MTDELELPLVDGTTRDWIARRTEDLFLESGALTTGHFALKSGRHGDRYVEKFQVLQYPVFVSELCGFVAERVRRADGRPLVDVVAGPTTGGVILAFEVARQLGVRGIFAEEVRDEAGGSRREFRRGFSIAEGERVLLVDDILTTGGSLVTMLPAVELTGGVIVTATVLVDRSGGTTAIASPGSGRSYPVDSLWALDLPTYEPGAGCPGCAAGVPVVTPGASGAGPKAAAPGRGDPGVRGV
jgi:orotate phosphoribosyltransferase